MDLLIRCSPLMLWGTFAPIAVGQGCVGRAYMACLSYVETQARLQSLHEGKNKESHSLKITARVLEIETLVEILKWSSLGFCLLSV